MSRAYFHALGAPAPDYAPEILSAIATHAGKGLFHRNIVIAWLGWPANQANRARATHCLAWLSTVGGGAHLRRMGNRGKLLIYQRTEPRPAVVPRPELTPSELDYMHALERRPE